MKMNICHKMCLVILFIAIRIVFAFQCPTNDECHCKKWPLFKDFGTVHSWVVDINCIINNNPAFRILIIDYNINVKCINSSNLTDFNLYMTLETCNSILFENCNLNNIKLIDIMQKLRVTGKNCTELTIYKYNNLILKKQNLEGFENIKSLSVSENNVIYMDKDLLADLKELTTLALYDNNLQDLDVEFFDYTSQLNRLFLKQNNLKMIKFSTFDKLKNLKILILANNNLTELQLGTFDKLDALKTLDVSSNNIVSLSKAKDIFAKLKNLVFLYLRNNSFTNLPRDLLQNNTKLEEVDLSYNQKNLTLLDGFFSNLTNLKLVKLDNNGLVALPEDLFWGSSSLETIILNNNYLQSLHVNIFQNLTELKILDLNFNNLEDLPDDIFRSTNQLQKLDLSNNRITSISEQLFNGLYLLEKLSMENNYLKNISKSSFRSLKKLKTLNLSNNHLEVLPNNIFSDTQQLKTLDLSNNRMTVFSEKQFSRLMLDELNMERNYLKTISCDSFNYLTNVKIIKMSNNNLTIPIDDESVHPVSSSLQELHLANNNISKICDNWRLQPNNLYILDLSYNNIFSLNEKNLLFISKDITVNLTHNKIQHIILPDETLPDYKAEILLEHNPLNCNCDILSDLLRYKESKMRNVQSNFLIDLENLICHSPKKMEKVRIDDLNFKNLTCKIKNTDSITVCPERCDCFVRPYNKAFIFDCSNKNLTSVPSDINEPHISLIRVFTSSINSILQLEFNFSYNALMHMPNLRTMKLRNESVKHLILSHNNISKISSDKLSTTIKVLELHNNSLSRIHPDVLTFWKNSINLTRLTLHENPWACDCDATELLNFTQTIKSEILPERYKIMCHKEKKFMSDMTFNDFCPFDTTIIIRTSATIATAISLIGLIFGLYYKYQIHIKIWLYAHQWCLWFVTEEELDKDKLYDAFVSFSHKDNDFVENEMVPKLESGPTPFKLCLHYRDWLAGEWISDNIARSVENSRRTIVVLSPNFLESVWGRMEFRTAHCQALNEGRARVIIILYGDIEPTDDLDPELRAYISMNTYIRWGDPWFWDKLKYALPHQSKQPKRNSVRREVLENYEL